MKEHTKRNLNLTCKNVRTAHTCVHIIVHNYCIQHSTAVLIIFPLILQPSTKAQMLSIAGDGNVATIKGKGCHTAHDHRLLRQYGSTKRQECWWDANIPSSGHLAHSLVCDTPRCKAKSSWLHTEMVHQPKSTAIAHWLVLISLPAEGRRLSWPE